MLDGNWISVNSNNEVPTGLWLVKTKDGGLQVFDNASQHPNVKTIGHYFEFDEVVTMYWDQPLPLPEE